MILINYDITKFHYIGLLFITVENLITITKCLLIDDILLYNV
jgi:hypothetical protein